VPPYWADSIIHLVMTWQQGIPSQTRDSLLANFYLKNMISTYSNGSSWKIRQISKKKNSDFYDKFE
jgi:hypothetical protein